MRFFRRRSSLGFLALLAFAMQAVLAFAQTHAHTHAAARSRGKLADARASPTAPARRAPSILSAAGAARRRRRLPDLLVGQPRDGGDPASAAADPDAARALRRAGAGQRGRCPGRWRERPLPGARPSPLLMG